MALTREQMIQAKLLAARGGLSQPARPTPLPGKKAPATGGKGAVYGIGVSLLSAGAPMAIKAVNNRRTVKVREAGLELTAGLRDFVISAGAGPSSHNDRLAYFTKLCLAAGKARVGAERRARFKETAREATRVARRVEEVHLNGAEATDRKALLKEIDQFQEAVEAL